MSYILETNLTITMPVKSNNPVVAELLSNYTYGKKWNIKYTESNCITIGDYTQVEFSEGECVINITDGGVYISGKDYAATMRGFMTFLEKITYLPEEDYFYIPTCLLYEKPLISFRSVHLCIFPETKLDFFKKCVRSCAITKFSHIIFEFWGMLKYDCLKELAWPFAYSKEQIKEIVAEANALGVEIIPMFNHLGHASACRGAHGKHVVLDQNPRYEYMFESYGWNWNYKRDDVYALLGKIRDELIEVCGEGDYFHIGCDEANRIGSNETEAKSAVEYINRLAKDISSKGRKTIVWHDMMISREEFPDYIEANATPEVSEIFLNGIDKDIIIADWHYFRHDETWKPAEKFKSLGFNVLCCPWHIMENIEEAVETITENNLFGFMETTWHTLADGGFYKMLYAAVLAYGTDKTRDEIFSYAASVARKALPSCGIYENSGWSEVSVGTGIN